jgi:hypothetical protein
MWKFYWNLQVGKKAANIFSIINFTSYNLQIFVQREKFYCNILKPFGIKLGVLINFQVPKFT